MNPCELKIERLHPDAVIPRKATETDACFDLYACRSSIISVGETAIVKIGLAFELEQGWEIQIRGRSGLASRGIMVHFGTVDHSYRLEVGVIIHNYSGKVFQIVPGDRIAQMAVAPVWPVTIAEEAVSKTARGGFGSTGV